MMKPDTSLSLGFTRAGASIMAREDRNPLLKEKTTMRRMGIQSPRPKPSMGRTAITKKGTRRNLAADDVCAAGVEVSVCVCARV